MTNYEAYQKWLEDEWRSPAERASRWALIGPVIPLQRWRDIAQEHSTWDAVVECEDSLTTEEREAIMGLGYYGHTIHPVHGTWISQGHHWEHKQKGEFTLTLCGPEGPGEKKFKTLEKAEEYIRPRIQWCNAGDGGSFNTDFINYELEGFVLQDVGIDPKDWRP